MLSTIGSEIIAAAAERFGPIPESFAFGDGIDWSSPLGKTLLYVELPFWLMVPAGPVNVEWSETTFTVDVCSPWMEVFGGRVVDSRASVIHHGPWRPTGWDPPEHLAAELARLQMAWLQWPCKTVLRLTARAHASAFRELGDRDPLRAQAEQWAYWASLCEAHAPVVNELICDAQHKGCTTPQILHKPVHEGLAEVIRYSLERSYISLRFLACSR